jgi:hypothetical protein
VLKTVDKSPVYSAGMVVFNQLLLHTPGVGETIIYQTPSSLNADFETTAKSNGELPLAALMEKDRLVVMRHDDAGYFSLLRFTQENGRWELRGIVQESDFNDTNRFAPVVCSGTELIDWSTVQLKMSDGSKRLLNIDDEGVVHENGKVHEYTNVIKDPDLTQEQHYKEKQLNLLRGYFLPRDVNGVPVSQINAIKRSLVIVDTPGGTTPTSGEALNMSTSGTQATSRTDPQPKGHLAITGISTTAHDTPPIIYMAAICILGVCVLIYFAFKR